MLQSILDFKYVFKIGSEIMWAVAMAVVVTVLPILAGTDVDVILADPVTWLQMLGAASARAALAGLLLAVRGVLQHLVSSRDGG